MTTVDPKKNPVLRARIETLKKAARELADEDLDRFTMVLRRWLVAPKPRRRDKPT